MKKVVGTFADCSQWGQAEELRFILEANSRRQFQNSGSVVWQLNEPWPNVSCTNFVDYYHELKMAYYWVKDAFEPNRASLDYRRLDYRPGARFEAGAFVHRAGDPAAYRLKAELLDAAGRMLGSWAYGCGAHLPGDEHRECGGASRVRAGSDGRLLAVCRPVVSDAVPRRVDDRHRNLRGEAGGASVRGGRRLAGRGGRAGSSLLCLRIAAAVRSGG